MTSLEGLTIVKDICVAGAAIAAAVVASLGLTSWKRELRGKVDFETARALIKAAYKLRDEISDCRAPMLTGSEFPEGYKLWQAQADPREEAQAYAHVYRNRMGSVRTSLSELDAAVLEAEALWGSDIRRKADKLRQCVVELHVAIEALVRDKEAGGRDFESDRDFGRKMRATVSRSVGADDELSLKVADAISDVERSVGPHLRRKAA